MAEPAEATMMRWWKGWLRYARGSSSAATSSVEVNPVMRT